MGGLLQADGEGSLLVHVYKTPFGNGYLWANGKDDPKGRVFQKTSRKTWHPADQAGG